MTGTVSSAVDIGISKLAGNIGAVISGVDASGPLSDDSIAVLRQALLEHKVIFLRGQRLDYDDLVAFGQRFGTLTLGHPIYGGPEGKPLLREVDSHSGTIRANHWHTDFTYMAA